MFEQSFGSRIRGWFPGVMHQAAGLDSTPGSAAGVVLGGWKAQMSRRYQAEVIGVEGRPPAGFRWRRRRYRVREVLAHWVEATAWWQGSNAGSSRTQEVWRVEAVSRTGDVGVYDLVVNAEVWRLLRVID